MCHGILFQIDIDRDGTCPKFQVQHLLDCRHNCLIDVPAVVYSLTSLTTLYST